MTGEDLSTTVRFYSNDRNQYDSLDPDTRRKFKLSDYFSSTLPYPSLVWFNLCSRSFFIGTTHNEHWVKFFTDGTSTITQVVLWSNTERDSTPSMKIFSVDNLDAVPDVRSSGRGNRTTDLSFFWWMGVHHFLFWCNHPNERPLKDPRYDLNRVLKDPREHN